MYQNVIFDLDGTLLNTLEDLKDSTNYALAQHGYPTRTLEEVRCFVGNGIRKLIDRQCRREQVLRKRIKSLQHSVSIMQHIRV